MASIQHHGKHPVACRASSNAANIPSSFEYPALHQILRYVPNIQQPRKHPIKNRASRTAATTPLRAEHQAITQTSRRTPFSTAPNTSLRAEHPATQQISSQNIPSNSNHLVMSKTSRCEAGIRLSKTLTPTSVLRLGLDRQRSSSFCLLCRAFICFPGRFSSRAVFIQLSGTGNYLPLFQVNSKDVPRRSPSVCPSLLRQPGNIYRILCCRSEV